MSRMIKAFCTGQERKDLVDKYGSVVDYDSFVLLEVSNSAAKAIAKQVPTEDISDEYVIRVGEELIDTSIPRAAVTGKLKSHPAYKGVKKLPPGAHHHLVQFIGPVKKSWLTRVKRLGGELRRPYANFAYVVRCDEETLSKIIDLPFVRWAGHLSHRNRLLSKIDPDKGALPRSRYLPSVHVVEFFDRGDLSQGLKQLKKHKVKILSSADSSATATVELTGSESQQRKQLQLLSSIHGVAAVRNRSIKRTNNDVATGIMNADTAWLESVALTGNGETIAVCDTGIDSGDATNIHPDFGGRLATIESYPINPAFDPFIDNPGGDDGAADLDSGHGTHVAGSALGSGQGNNSNGNQFLIRGLAHEAELVFQAVEQELEWKSIGNELYYGRYLLAGLPDDLTPLFTSAYNNGARIHSNSWGGGDAGAYDEQCRQLDAFVWEHKDFCVVVAAGNDGTDPDENGVADGKINLTSVTSPATAKNCITVGASESLRSEFDDETYGSWWPNDYPVSPINDDPMANDAQQVVAFSSRGPTLDGRTKPEILAPGTFILSTRSRFIAASNTAWSAFPQNHLYFYMGGTSMATPLVAGAVAVLRQFLREWVGLETPSAALLKATVVLSGMKLPGYSPASHMADNHQGYGLINLQSIIDPPAPVQVWFYDQPDGLQTGQADELDIEVGTTATPLRIAMAYTDAPGERLVNNLNLMLEDPDGNVYVGNAVGTSMTPDTVNNHEVIQVTSPTAGTWKVRVIASNVPQGPQDFALAFSGDVE